MVGQNHRSLGFPAGTIAAKVAGDFSIFLCYWWKMAYTDQESHSGSVNSDKSLRHQGWNVREQLDIHVGNEKRYKCKLFFFFRKRLVLDSFGKGLCRGVGGKWPKRVRASLRRRLRHLHARDRMRSQATPEAGQSWGQRCHLRNAFHKPEGG